MNPAERAVRALDRALQRKRWTSFPYAVLRKSGDDQAGNLAALLAYYGFFSLFPLLLVLVTVLDMLLRRYPTLRHRIIGSALSDFPVIGTQISKNVHSLSGSGLTLAIGIAITLWAGLGVLKAMQTAMNSIWNVPFERRPNFLTSNVKALLMLVVLGSVTVVSAIAGGVGTGSGNWLLSVIGITLSLAINFVLFMLAFRILTTEDVSWADVRTGAIVAAITWTVLQALGGYYVRHELQGASVTYGTFGTVIGLLAWIYLGSQATLLAAEINVVKKRRLWPRAIMQPPLTEADKEALTIYAEQEKRRPEQDVEVRIEDRRP